MAAVHFALSVLSVCVFLTFGFGNEIFSEEYKIEEDMHGRELVVASRGRIRKTIDLNDQSIVAVSISFNPLSQIFYSYIYSLIKKSHLQLYFLDFRFENGLTLFKYFSLRCPYNASDMNF